MASKIHSFSVKEWDAENNKLIEELKAHCSATGKTFSFAVLEALKLLSETKLNAKG